MGIRTVEEYKASLRDGRRVYLRGEKVEDVTTHRILGVSVDTVAQGFALTASEDPEIRNLFTAPHPKTGEPINRYFVTPRNAEDLMLRTKMIQRSIELTGGLPFGKDIGTDCLNAAFHEVTTVHAEGSMAAQKMMILVEAPLKRYKEMAKRMAGITS